VKPKKKETKNIKCNQNNKVKRNTNLDKKEPTLARGLCDRSMLSAEEENLLETAFIVESSAGGGFATIKPCTVTTPGLGAEMRPEATTDESGRRAKVKPFTSSSSEMLRNSLEDACDNPTIAAASERSSKAINECQQPAAMCVVRRFFFVMHQNETKYNNQPSPKT
jgi:hypothetical protein